MVCSTCASFFLRIALFMRCHNPVFGLLSLHFVNHVSIILKHNIGDLPYIVYLFDTKHLLLRLAVDIDVLDLNHLANEIKSFDVIPFPVVRFPMDQGWKKEGTVF